VESSVGFSGHEYFATRASHHRLCLHRGFHDADERAAAADVAVELLRRLLARRVRIFLEERDGGDDEAGRAEAAHQRIDVAEGALHRMQRVAVREAVDGADLFALHLDRQRRAPIHRAAVDDHRAGAARSAIADAFVAGEIGARAKRVEQRDPRLDPEIDPLAVDGERDRHFTRAYDGGAGLRPDFARGKRTSGRCDAAETRRPQEIASADTKTIIAVRHTPMIPLLHVTTTDTADTTRIGRGVRSVLGGRRR
jgi:hypothetical protein